MRKRVVTLIVAGLIATTLAAPARGADANTREISGGVTVVNETALVSEGISDATVQMIVARYADDGVPAPLAGGGSPHGEQVK